MEHVGIFLIQIFLLNFYLVYFRIAQMQAIPERIVNMKLIHAIPRSVSTAERASAIRHISGKILINQGTFVC